MLHRAGPDWEAEQLVNVQRHGQRTYGCELGYQAEDVLGGMRELTQVCHRSRSSYLWRQLPAKLSFTMTARGGASLFELGLREQRTYFSRLFILLNGGDEDAEDICEDRDLREHLLDPVAVAHLKAYPTVEALRSKEGLVCLESQATILQESTQGIEHSHAGVKRRQRCREQTHTERTSIASAMRILHGERRDVSKVIPRRWRSGDGASGPVARSGDGASGPVAKAKKLSAKAKAKAQARQDRPRKQERRPRARSLRQAWVAINVKGRLATAADHAKLEREILDPNVRAMCEAKAKELTALARLGPVAPNDRPVRDRRLRQMRENARKFYLKWDIQRARRVLAREDRQSHGPFQRRKL